LQNPFIGRFEVGEVKPLPDGGNQKVKVKVRINLNGVFTVCSASSVEKQEVEEDIPMEVDDLKLNGDSPAAGAEAEKSGGAEAEKSGSTEEKVPETENPDPDASKKEAPKMEKRKKVVTKNIDLPVTPLVVGSLSREKLERSLEQEKSMNRQDKQEVERLHAKNAVEEYIYSIREKIGEELEEYLAPDDRTRCLLNQKLQMLVYKLTHLTM
jgi:molecular chaperone DnaK (HSP70)